MCVCVCVRERERCRVQTTKRVLRMHLQSETCSCSCSAFGWYAEYHAQPEDTSVNNVGKCRGLWKLISSACFFVSLYAENAKENWPVGKYIIGASLDLVMANQM